LEVLLNEHAQGTSFEVINAAVTAMNSHVARRIAKDCAAHDPDLFIVFMGNNEVVGPYGPPTLPGSLYSSRGFIDAAITAKKETRVGQLVKNAGQAWGAKDRPENKWQGMESFLTSRITAEDPKLQDCYRHFRDNLVDILRTARRSGAQVLLCTVPINLESCAPFGSQHRADLSKDDLARWEQAFQEGRALERAGDFAGALSAYDKARRIDDSHADLMFCVGRSLAALGRRDEAREAFGEARDRDVLRFRADSSILRTIRETAQARSDKGVRLLDLDVYLGPADVFVDHVHVSFRGNFLAARAAMEQIREMIPQGRLIEPEGHEEQLFDLCRRRLLYDEHEEYRLAMVMYRRKTIPPFAGQLDHDIELANLREELVRLRRIALGVKDSESAYLDAIRQRPLDTYLTLRYGQFLTAAGRPRDAIDLYRKALDARPFDVRVRVALAQVLIQGSLKDEAVRVLTARETPDHLSHRQALLLLGAHCGAVGNVPQAIAIYEELGRIDPRNADVAINRAAAASQLNDLATMKRCLDKALALDPESVQARINMGNYHAKRNQPSEARTWFAKAAQVDPHNPFAHIGLGIQSVRLEEMDEAVEHLTRTLALKPDFVEAHLLLAALHDQAGRKDQSKRHMELATLFRSSPQP
jgi:tetratricopeptide (TPR) repeat protein